MADINSALPIRSEADGADQRVQVKIVDSVAPSTPENQVTVSENLVHNRTHGQDPGGVKRQLRLSEGGEVAIDGTYDGSVNSNPANVGIVVQERNAASADSRQTMKPTAVRGTTAANQVSLDVSLHDEAGEAYSQDNPLPVSIEESEGEEVCDRRTSSSVAAAASVNHDYTVTASTVLVLDGWYISASGRIKAVLSVETSVGSDEFTIIQDAFTTAAKLNEDFPLNKTVKVEAGVRVRITLTNRDLLSQDVYSQLRGVEKAA